MRVDCIPVLSCVLFRGESVIHISRLGEREGDVHRPTRLPHVAGLSTTHTGTIREKVASEMPQQSLGSSSLVDLASQRSEFSPGRLQRLSCWVTPLALGRRSPPPAPSLTKRKRYTLGTQGVSAVILRPSLWGIPLYGCTCVWFAHG